MSNLFFLYDRLMTKAEQKKIGVSATFIAYGVISAKLYFFNDDKKKRLFIDPVKGGSTDLVYGGIFKIEELSIYEHKLHSYYNNLLPFTGFTFQEDIFVPEVIQVKPIIFSSLKEIEKCAYQRLQNIECSVFVGNLQNKKIKNSIKRGRYYRRHSVDANSFITMIGDNNG